jgi:uncharacterized protein
MKTSQITRNTLILLLALVILIGLITAWNPAAAQGVRATATETPAVGMTGTFTPTPLQEQTATATPTSFPVTATPTSYVDLTPTATPTQVEGADWIVNREVTGTILVSGNASIMVEPDEVVITLGIETNDFDLSVAKRQNDQVVRSVLDLTQKYAIDSRYVQTDYIHIEPRYESGIQRRQNFLGYFVQKTIEIRLRDVSMFENFYSDVLEAGVTHVQGIEFRTTELRKYRDQARELALTAAKEKAVAMSAVLDQMIGQVKMIREDRSDWSGSYSWWWGSQGGFMAQNVIQNQGGAAFTEEGTLAPGQISVSAIVTVEFELVK